VAGVGSPERVSERRLVAVVSAAVFVDTLFYSVIAPLLPGLVAELHLSKLSAGVLTASYPIGTLLGAVPGGVLVARAGAKLTMLAGLAILAISTIAFALLHNIASLDAARLIEGVGGACTWAGGIAWIVGAAPPGRRGALMGRAIGAAIGGALFGPVIGALATAIGRVPAFSVIVVAALALLVETARLPVARVDSDQGVGHLLAALRARRILIGIWLVALPAVASGTITVLAPLRLHDFGAGAAAIAATFLAASAIEAAVAPITGQLSDRRGRVVPLRIGLAVTAALLVCFDLPSAAFALAVLVVAIIGALGVFWAPAMAMLSDAAELHGLDQGLAAALMNLAWAVGQIVGSGASGAIAKSAGDLLPMVIWAALCLATLAALSRPSVRLALR
jgi:MFS family permease